MLITVNFDGLETWPGRMDYDLFSFFSGMVSREPVSLPQAIRFDLDGAFINHRRQVFIY